MEKSLAGRTLDLSAEAHKRLEAWMESFAEQLDAAEDTLEAFDLKEFIQFLTALKRVVEIARIAEGLRPDDEQENQNCDFESLKQLIDGDAEQSGRED